MSRILVGIPGSSRFELPPRVPQLSVELGERLRRTARTGIFVWVLMCVFALTLFYLSWDKWFLAFGGVTSLMATVFALDRFAGIDDSRGVTERSTFFFWLQSAHAPRLAFLVFSIVGISAGLTQFFLQNYVGGLEPLVMQYGFYFTSVRSGELWRVFSVPFFHSGLVHFLNNYFLLILVAPIAWGMAGAIRTITVFLGACYVTPFLQMLWAADSFDSYLGASSGIFGMIGLVVGLDLLKKSVLPKGFIFSFFGFAILSVVIAELLSPSAATISHLAGFVIGLLFSLFPVKEHGLAFE
jgi:membrane associated rhomboid family serine protease